MDLFEAINNRRSIRKYISKKIDNDLILKIIKAGMQAPSAGNQQPWHFIIIDDKLIFNKIMEIHPHSKMLTEADKAIFIIADINLEKYTNYWPLDCAAAVQNMLLAAHGLGLGAVWLGVYPRQERMIKLKELFNLPENIKPFALISLGYPAEQKQFEDRFKPERIHYNKWKEKL